MIIKLSDLDDCQIALRFHLIKVPPPLAQAEYYQELLLIVHSDVFKVRAGSIHNRGIQVLILSLIDDVLDVAFETIAH